jgi:hypothetical protein
MCLSAVKAVSRYAVSQGDQTHIVALNSPEFSWLKDYVPWTLVSGKLQNLMGDSRLGFSKFSSDEVEEIYRAPFLASTPWRRLKRAFGTEVLSRIEGPLAAKEAEALEDIGPPFDTSWKEYYKDRFWPHYRPYSGSGDLSKIMKYFDMISSAIVSQHNGRLKPWPLEDVFARRRVESDMGFYHMRSLKTFEPWERYMLMDNIKLVTEWWDANPESRRFAIIPGTRISHAAIGAEAEDYNRVIMSVDVYAWASLGRWAYPILSAFRDLPWTNAIYGYKALERFIQENPEYGFISLDTSRMDQSIKYDPLGKLYAEFVKKTVDIDDDIIDSEVYAAHHPVIVTPGGVFHGPIGNASGKTDTTNENTLYSLALGYSFMEEQGISMKDGFVQAVGDDTLIIYKRSKKSFPVSASKLVAEHWAKYGFRAKEEKQEFSGDTALFLKRRFSRDPRVGESTMLLTNVLKKLVYMQPSQFARLYSSRFNDDFDYVTMLRYLRVLNAERKYLSRIEKEKKKGNAYPTLSPPPTALWPYYIPNEAAIGTFLGWEGPYGPLTRTHLASATALRERLCVIPDSSATYMIGVFQALSQCVTHPWFPEFISFLSRYAVLPHNVDWIGFLADLGESELNSYHQEGGVGPILYALSLFLKDKYKEVSPVITSRVEVWLETAPSSLRRRFYTVPEPTTGVPVISNQNLDSGDSWVLEAIERISDEVLEQEGDTS